VTQRVRHAIDAVVTARDQVAHDVVLLRLEEREGKPLPTWAPGAHVDVYLPAGARQYSLCGDPRQADAYTIAILRQPQGRGGSEFIHAKYEIGSDVRIGRPRNHFTLVEAPHYVFVAGGIGITPIRPMVQDCDRREVPWTLHYGGRNRRSMAFVDEFGRFGDRVSVVPQDELGLLRLDDLMESAPRGAAVYCCGPEGLLEGLEASIATRPDLELRTERFAPARPKHVPDDVSFDVYCQESGVTISVGAQETLLDALVSGGVNMNYDCLEGTCGTCELEVVDGIPDHRDAIQGGRERDGSMILYPCVSRSRSPRLVLDV
jgi:ferredoxin-NADP reductase